MTSEASPPLLTPVRLKTGPNDPWPEEPVSYLLAGNDLFLCRNHRLFRSCVPAPTWPRELARQATFLEPRFPPLPAGLFARMVGFFDAVARRHGAEAIVLLALDTQTGEVHPVVPEQVAVVSIGWRGTTYAESVEYQPPEDLPDGWVVIADVHSHVHAPAGSSWIDHDDEQHSAGLHIIVGRIHREPPDVRVEAVVDGTRFKLSPEPFLQGYAARNLEFPPEWLDRLEVVSRSHRGTTSIRSLPDTEIDPHDDRNGRPACDERDNPRPPGD